MTATAATGPDSLAPPVAAAPLSALLLLTDGRFPAGAHAHSGGLEAAAALEGVHDVAGLESYLRGRAATAGAVLGSRGSTATSAPLDVLGRLDAEFAARTPSPALRAASRRLGRQLLRSARQVCRTGRWTSSARPYRRASTSR